MDVADGILNVRLQLIRDREDSILLYIALVLLTSVSFVVIVEHAVCILNTLTPVLTTILYAVNIEVFPQCFTESVSLRETGKSTSRAEISSPISSYLKAVKGALLWSALGRF